MIKHRLKQFAMKAGKYYLDRAMDTYVHPYYETRRQALAPSEHDEKIAEVMTNPDLRIMRDKVSDVIEEALSAVIWKPRIRDAQGDQAPVQDSNLEFIIMQMIPVVIVETGTYTIMVRVMEKESKVEKDVMTLAQFLSSFVPMKALTFDDANA